MNFFKNNPYYKCNFDELLSLNKVEEDDKEILKKVMQDLLSCKKLFNNSSYYNDLQNMSVGLSPLGEKIFEQGYILTNTIITENYTCYYDIATQRFLTEEESKTVRSKEQSFFHNKDCRFLRAYLQADNSFLFGQDGNIKLPVPLQISDSNSDSKQENTIVPKIKDGFCFSKQKLSKKKPASRLIKNGLSFTCNSNKISYHIDKKYEETFKIYSDEYFKTVLNKPKNNNSDTFNFNSTVFKYLSWTTEELSDLFTKNNYLVFIPDKTKAAVPCSDENKIVRVSQKLFAPKSEFEFFVYALDYMYSISQSFYNSKGFKDYQGNRISKEKFFQPFKFYLENPEADTLFMEILPVVEKTNSLDLFINTIKQIKKIALQKLLAANRFFKNNPEWQGFFKKYMQDFIFKDMLQNGYNNLKNLLALQRIAEISQEDILELIEKTEYNVTIHPNHSLSLPERKCLWYDELYLHNFARDSIQKNILALAPFFRDKKEISEDIHAVLSDEFKQLIDKAIK